MDTFTVTVGQLVLSSPQDVYRQIDATFGQHPDTDLFVFPEFATQDSVNLATVDYLHAASEARETAQRWVDLVPDFRDVRALSEELRQAVLVGCLAQEDGKLFSRATFYDPHHRQMAFYDKSHIHWTEGFLRPGAAIEPIQTRFGKIGVLMCYDMAFSEAPRVLGIRGTQVLFALSAIPMDFHWRYAHHRMIGAAVFNQYYVVAANLGHALEAPMGGYSGIYNPEGDLIAQVDDSDYGCVTANIDLGRVMRWRETELVYPRRRPHLYGAIAAPVDQAERQGE